MITLNKISRKHLDAVADHTGMSKNNIEKMIKNSDSKEFNEHFFEMYVIMDEEKTIVFQQVRINNTASIKLHTKLGFETNQAVFKNRNQNDVYIN